MRKIFVCLLALFAIVFSLATAYAAGYYTYFDIVNTNYPEDSINSDNVVYVGGVYYMSQQDGSMFYSHDAASWHIIDGSYGAKIISDKKSKSDFLAVFYNGNLAKSYDGANFELIRKFDANTVIKYDNNIYTAYENTGADGATLHFSYDCENWFELPGVFVLDGQFTIDSYPDRYIVNGINTPEGAVSAIILSPGEVYVMPYSHLTFDKENGCYAAIESVDGGFKLWLSDATGAEFGEVLLPANTPLSFVSYSNGDFYIMASNGVDAYKNSGKSSWEWTDRFYMPVYKSADSNGAMREIYAWQDITRNGFGVFVKNISKAGKVQTSSVELSGELKMGIYGKVLCATDENKPVNLLSYDGINWHQTEDAEAFSILNEHTLRGKYMFVDETTNHTVFVPNDYNNPYEDIRQRGVEVRIEGHYIAFDQPPVVINDRTMVPLRAISEALGATVGYDAATREITISKNSNVINMTVGADKATITYYDGAVYESVLDSPSVLVNDRTLVPVRFISEAFNMNVEWAANDRTVWITAK